MTLDKPTILGVLKTFYSRGVVPFTLDEVANALMVEVRKTPPGVVQQSMIEDSDNKTPSFSKAVSKGCVEEGSFSGDTITSDDEPRLRKQLKTILELMKDGQQRTLYEINEATGFPEQSISVRLRDLSKPEFGGYKVERQRDRGTFWYRLLLSSSNL